MGQFEVIVCIILAFLSMLLCAFFCAAEAALLTCHRAKLEHRGKRAKRRGARAALWLLDHFDLAYPALLLGSLLSLILFLIAGGVLVSDFLGFGDLLHIQTAGPPISGQAVSGAQVNWAVCFIDVIVLFSAYFFLGRLIPSTLGLTYPDTVLRMLALPLRLFIFICWPVVRSGRCITSAVLAPFRLRFPEKIGGNADCSEISLLLSFDRSEKGLSQMQRDMLRGVVGFSETVVREIMTPRTDVVGIDTAASLPEVLSIIADSGCSRFPIMHQGLDDILGILLVKDLLPHLSRFSGEGQIHFSMLQFMREAYFVPATKPVLDLLGEFKRRKMHMAVVLDEHGGMDGIVTLEDVLEGFVGDIFDESEAAKQQVVVHGNGEMTVDGGTLVSELNERFDVGIPKGEYDTVAGFIFTTLGRLPQRGDQIIVRHGEAAAFSYIDEKAAAKNGLDDHTNGLNGETTAAAPADEDAQVLTVERVDTHRIESVRCKRLPFHEFARIAQTGKKSLVLN